MGHHQGIRRGLAVVAALMGLARAAGAQTPAPSIVDVGDFFRTLYGPAIRDVAANGGPTLIPHNFGSADILNSLLVAEIVNLPTTTNAGGFSWTYDSTLGTWGRAVDSFGPQFVERSLTAGRHKSNFGFAYQRFTFDRLNGEPFSAAHLDAFGDLNGSAPLLQRIHAQDHVSLSKADVTLATMFVNFGVTSMLDLGVFLPTSSIVLDGSVTYTLQRTTPALDLTRTATASAKSNVAGPPVFRAKWNALRRDSGGFSLALDVRPHIDAPLAAGGFKFQGIASRTSRAVNVHVNGGFLNFECDAPSLDEKACTNVNTVFAAGAVDKAVTGKLTVSAEVLAHFIDYNLRGPLTLPSGVEQLTLLNRQTHRYTMAFTGRVNLWGNLLLNLTAMTSTNSLGLSDRFTPAIGLDYAW